MDLSCGTNLLEGPGQHLLTVLLSIPFNYLPCLKADWFASAAISFLQGEQSTFGVLLY